MNPVVSIVLPLSIAILWHELGHALFALATTRGRVTLSVGFGPGREVAAGRLTLRFGVVLLGGFCRHDSPDRPGDRALIAAAGPVFSIFLAALAWYLRDPLAAGFHRTLSGLAGEVAVTSFAIAVITLIPVRYSAAADSDGLAIIRALAPASRVALGAPAAEPRPGRPLRLPYLIVLLGVIPLAFAANVWLGLMVGGMFGLVYRRERSGA